MKQVDRELIPRPGPGRRPDVPDISGSTQTISERILAEHRKSADDDALAVAVRYLGLRP